DVSQNLPPPVQPHPSRRFSQLSVLLPEISFPSRTTFFTPFSAYALNPYCPLLRRQFSLSRPPELSMTPAPALFSRVLACTLQPSAESWLTTPSLLLPPAEPKFCTVRNLIVTSRASPPKAYKFLCWPSRIAPVPR